MAVFEGRGCATGPQQIPRIRRSIAPRIGGKIGRNRRAVTRRYHAGAKVNGVLTEDVMSSINNRQITNLIYPTNLPDHDLRLPTHRHLVHAEGKLGILGSNRHLGFLGDWPAGFRLRM